MLERASAKSQMERVSARRWTMAKDSLEGCWKGLRQRVRWKGFRQGDGRWQRILWKDAGKGFGKESDGKGFGKAMDDGKGFFGRMLERASAKSQMERVSARRWT